MKRCPSRVLLIVKLDYARGTECGAAAHLAEHTCPCHSVPHLCDGESGAQFRIFQCCLGCAADPEDRVRHVATRMIHNIMEGHASILADVSHCQQGARTCHAFYMMHFLDLILALWHHDHQRVVQGLEAIVCNIFAYLFAYIGVRPHSRGARIRETQRRAMQEDSGSIF